MICVPLLTGCADPYRRLVPERSIPEFAEALDRAAAAPGRFDRVAVRMSDGTPVRLAVYETGPGDRERLVVMLHGALADARTWKFVTGYLCDAYDLLAVDLPGCARSDAPDPRQCGPEAYTPDGIATPILLAVRARLAARDVRTTPPAEAECGPLPGPAPRPRITLVGHSLGATSILRMLGSPALRAEFDDVLSLVDSAVLIAPPDPATITMDSGFRAVADAPPIVFALADLTGVLRYQVGKVTVISSTESGRATRENADWFMELLRDPAGRRAQQELIRRAVPQVRPWERDWAAVRRLAADYGRVRVPCLIVWGERDDNLSPAMGYRLLAELPDARLRVVRDATHSVALDRPAACAALVREFVAAAAGRTIPVVAQGDPAVRPGGPPVAVIDPAGGAAAIRGTFGPGFGGGEQNAGAEPDAR